ncbi:MAG: alpha-galactosidase, partial [Deltaproteobacteria bacterium]|nr:alpha-galactosidase [Deltaproteobacteria bacterium]
MDEHSCRFEALALVLACGMSCEPPGPNCREGAAADGTYTLQVGDLCLQEIGVRVRRGGTWEQVAAVAALEPQPVDDIGRLLQVAVEEPAEAIEIAFPGLPADRLLQQGYQSWSFAGAVKIPRHVELHEDGAPRMREAATGETLDAEYAISYYAAALQEGAGGPALVFGSLAAERAVTGFAAVAEEPGARLIALYGPTREALPSDADGKVRSEPLLVLSAGQAGDGLQRLGQEMQRAPAAGARQPRRPPGGWFSWNEHRAEIDEAMILAHVDEVAEQLLPHQLPLLEIDDGWERSWGDWQANDRFPRGMAAVAGDIAAAGLIAGIWLAPFLVDEQAPAASLDDRLFVRAVDGSRLQYRKFGDATVYYVLDGSDPDAMALVAGVLRDLARAGFAFFKLDYLFAGALPGVRNQPVTGVQALRQGLLAMREAVGPDAVINACGAPLLPVVGIADSLRIGADTFINDLSWQFIAFAARDLAARTYLAPVIWPDADQVQLRPPYSVEEAGVGALIAALAGPAYSIGDDLSLLAPERLAIGLEPTV